ncbi:MAG: hypothetical protein AAFR49_07435 [Pseudomonadota bacterium]
MGVRARITGSLIGGAIGLFVAPIFAPLAPAFGFMSIPACWILDTFQTNEFKLSLQDARRVTRSEQRFDLEQHAIQEEHRSAIRWTRLLAESAKSYNQTGRLRDDFGCLDSTEPLRWRSGLETLQGQLQINSQNREKMIGSSQVVWHYLAHLQCTGELKNINPDDVKDTLWTLYEVHQLDSFYWQEQLSAHRRNYDQGDGRRLELAKQRILAVEELPEVCGKYL